MRLIPAVDIQGGKAVRLVEGDPERETVYFEDPVGAALYWEEQGASFLHVVDLDAAIGSGDNRGQIRRIAAALTMPFEVGGGVRTLADAEELLELGAERVVIGTVFAKRPEEVERMLTALGPEKVVPSLDGRGLELTVAGWREGGAGDVLEMARRAAEMGFTSLIFTDVRRDGTLEGLDLEVIARVREAWPHYLIAGGGVASDEDLEGLERLGVEAAIAGKALYEGTVDGRRWWAAGS
ncbi:1-(5-phosphoribosyl)-5-[(5-phosphoribosylamino)methylideneamino]imidazole-4-carboxamide isomerase [Oceanithermus sp.]